MIMRTLGRDVLVPLPLVGFRTSGAFAGTVCMSQAATKPNQQKEVGDDIDELLDFVLEDEVIESLMI